MPGSRLAQVAEDRGFPDAAAWHRAYATSGPDEQVAEELELTAARAGEGGGYAAQAAFLTLAAQRSIPDTEDHARRLLAAAHAHVIVGNGAQAERLLDGCNPTGSLGARAVAVRVAAADLADHCRTGLEAAMLSKAADDLPSDERELARDDPPGHGTRILPDLAEAAVRTGDDALAQRVLDELTARATAAATPWAMGILARTRALVHGTSSEAEPPLPGSPAAAGRDPAEYHLSKVFRKLQITSRRRLKDKIRE